MGSCPKKRNWEGAPGAGPTHDCAFYLPGINKGDAVSLSSSPRALKITFKLISSALRPHGSLCVSLRSHPALLYSSRGSGFIGGGRAIGMCGARGREGVQRKSPCGTGAEQ